MERERRPKVSNSEGRFQFLQSCLDVRILMIWASNGDVGDKYWAWVRGEVAKLANVFGAPLEANVGSVLYPNEREQIQNLLILCQRFVELLHDEPSPHRELAGLFNEILDANHDALMILLRNGVEPPLDMCGV